MSRDLQAPLDTTQHRGAFVMLEVMPGTGAQLDQNIQQQLLGHGGIAFGAGWGGLDLRVVGGGQHNRLGIAPQFQQLLRHFHHRQHQVDHLGFDGRQRHAIVLGVFRRLYQGDTALLFDPRQPHRTV